MTVNELETQFYASPNKCLCCWTGRVGEREEEENNCLCCWTGRVGEQEEEGNICLAGFH